MYLVALCDDDVAEMDKVERMLKSYQEQQTGDDFLIRRFMEAEELILLSKEKAYDPDLILLDIYLPDKLGIDVAKEVREIGNRGQIIFLTSSKEHALDAFEVDAIQYLVKPLKMERFFHALKLALGNIQKIQEENFVINTVSGIRQIPIDDIIYCESRKNYQILCLKAGKSRVRMSGGELYQKLGCFSCFLRCGRSYILNINHIFSIKRDEVCMDNESKIYIPKEKVAEFRKMYFSYYFSKEEFR